MRTRLLRGAQDWLDGHPHLSRNVVAGAREVYEQGHGFGVVSPSLSHDVKCLREGFGKAVHGPISPKSSAGTHRLSGTFGCNPVSLCPTFSPLEKLLAGTPHGERSLQSTHPSECAGTAVHPPLPTPPAKHERAHKHPRQWTRSMYPLRRAANVEMRTNARMTSLHPGLTVICPPKPPYQVKESRPPQRSGNGARARMNGVTVPGFLKASVRADSEFLDASKVPPSRFQKRKGSIYATPGSRDGHVSRNYASEFHEKHAEKGYGKSKDS